MRRNGHPSAGRNGHDPEQHFALEFNLASDPVVDFDANGQNEKQPTLEKDPFQVLLGQSKELREYFSYYLSARVDSAKLGLRNALSSVTLAALAFVVAASLTAAAIWFVLNGAAEGLGVLFGNRPWAGSLLTGLLLMAGLGGGLFFLVIRLKKTAHEGTVAKYENRQSRQQARYGHNVAERAAADGPQEAIGPGPK